MIDEPLYGAPCPLCSRPLRIEYGRTHPSSQQDYPARIWIAARRCADCETARSQQWAEVMRARYET
ncbi:hypothetical protein ACSNOJ_29455 [Streptomyces sp. URMC 128]|uniref:hypothetical protein n=1 Tax=Streptomyces sp. URMC 128 TaxID=3423404 RepID=UPI003F1D9FA6